MVRLLAPGQAGHASACVGDSCCASTRPWQRSSHRHDEVVLSLLVAGGVTLLRCRGSGFCRSFADGRSRSPEHEGAAPGPRLPAPARRA